MSSFEKRVEENRRRFKKFDEEAEEYIDRELVPMFIEIAEEAKEPIREMRAKHGIKESDVELDELEVDWIITLIWTKAQTLLHQQRQETK